MPDPLPSSADTHVTDSDDLLAEMLADHLVDVVTSQDTDPFQRRGILNRFLASCDMPLLPDCPSREEMAAFRHMTPYELRQLELRAIERLRLSLGEILGHHHRQP